MKFNRQSLAELQAKNLPHMKASDIADIKEPSAEADAAMKRLDAYLQAFVRLEEGKCICCGAQQGAKDPIDAMLNARFEWGLVHGEGHCIVCGYPARAKHYIGEGDDQIRLNIILQYHPDGLSFDKPKMELETEQEVT